MSDETEKAFHRVLKRKLKPMIKEIDGYRHFLFLLENGCPAHNATYKTLLIRMIKKYNKTHDVPLPHITPHTLRHTKEYEPKEFTVYHGTFQHINNA